MRVSKPLFFNWTNVFREFDWLNGNVPRAESWEVPFEEISELQWVGSGAQGAVFLGKYHGEEVAVKKVRDIKETEIKHLRKLKHPNIITFKWVKQKSDYKLRPSRDIFKETYQHSSLIKAL